MDGVAVTQRWCDKCAVWSAPASEELERVKLKEKGYQERIRALEAEALALRDRIARAPSASLGILLANAHASRSDEHLAVLEDWLQATSLDAGDFRDIGKRLVGYRQLREKLAREGREADARAVASERARRRALREEARQRKGGPAHVGIVQSGVYTLPISVLREPPIRGMPVYARGTGIPVGVAIGDSTEDGYVLVRVGGPQAPAAAE